METLNINHPAYLFISSPEKCREKSIEFISNVLGKDSYDLILNKKHAQVIWISPEKNYILDDLKPAYNALQFKLDENQHFFIVLENIDMLSTVCAQSLLKSLEEPPKGYHFILLGQTKQAILPTIFSRCVLILDEEDLSELNGNLFDCFTSQLKKNSYSFFYANLSKNNIEHNLNPFIDAIYSYWVDQIKIAVNVNCKDDINTFSNILSCIEDAKNYLPLPFNNQLFIKNLYIQIKSII